MAALTAAFERLAARGLLAVDDANLAASQLNWLVMSAPRARGEGKLPGRSARRLLRIGLTRAARRRSQDRHPARGRPASPRLRRSGRLRSACPCLGAGGTEGQETASWVIAAIHPQAVGWWVLAVLVEPGRR